MNKLSKFNEIFILLLIFTTVYLVDKFFPLLNHRLLEPARFISIILVLAFLSRKVLQAALFAPEKLQDERTYIATFDFSKISQLIIKETKGMFEKTIKFKNALAVLIFMFAAVLSLAFYMHTFPTSSGFILLTFVYLCAFYISYLNFGKKSTKLFGLVGIFVIGSPIVLYGLIHLLNLALVVYIFWAFLLGLFANRKYIYTLALIFLIALPFLLILEQANPTFIKHSETVAFTAYLLLLLGAIKDLFYDYIFVE